MLRLLATLLDLLSGLLAIVAPIAVVHWLVGSLHIEALQGLVDFVGAFFNPFNDILKYLIPFNMPTIQWQGSEVELVQPILAFLITLGFFGTALAANTLRSLENQLVFSSAQRDFRQSTVKPVEQPVQHLQKSQLLVYILFPFDNQRAVTSYFSQYQTFRGIRKRIRSEGWLIQFDDSVQGLRYLQECMNKINRYYQTLDASEPRPPFQIAIHSLAAGDTNLFPALELCQLMIRYAGDNQIVTSEQVKQAAQTASSFVSVRLSSIGLYQLKQNQTEELYQLTA